MCRRCVQACQATSARMTICVQLRRRRVAASDAKATTSKPANGQNTGLPGHGGAHSTISGGAPPQECHSHWCRPQLEFLKIPNLLAAFESAEGEEYRRPRHP